MLLYFFFLIMRYYIFRGVVFVVPEREQLFFHLPSKVVKSYNKINQNYIKELCCLNNENN